MRLSRPFVAAGDGALWRAVLGAVVCGRGSVFLGEYVAEAVLTGETATVRNLCDRQVCCPEQSPCLFQATCLNSLPQRLSLQLPEAKLCEAARYSEMS